MYALKLQVYKGEFVHGLRHGLGSLYQAAESGLHSADPLPLMTISGRWEYDVYVGPASLSLSI